MIIPNNLITFSSSFFEVKKKQINFKLDEIEFRSADEGQTVFFTCLKCKFKESENS